MVLKEGEEVEAKFTGTDRKSRMLSLSIKAKDYEDEAEAVSDYSAGNEGAGGTTLGDLLKEQMGGFRARRAKPKKVKTTNAVLDATWCGQGRPTC